MSLHLIKLCVGVTDPKELVDWSRGRKPIVHTRMTPKKADEILEGGSLYWVIKGQVLVRQKILGIETLGEAPKSRCEIALDREVVLTAPQPRRAFQGWRYLSPADAPPDLEAGGQEGVPSELAAQLRSLGAW